MAVNHEELLLRYEAAKTLVILGCWEEAAVDILVDQLVNGSRNAKDDVIKAMINVIFKILKF